jgi:hypothetical protein
MAHGLHHLRSRFVRDYNLPIQVLQSPYFEYYIDLYEGYNCAKSKWDYLTNLVNIHYQGNENRFLEEYGKMRDLIITDMENSDAYKEFIECDMSKYAVNNEFGKISKQALYIEPNHNKYFISVDLKKANFQALKLHNPEIVSNCTDYEEFILHYLGKEHPALHYFQESKYSREVIFGKLNVPRQMTIQKFIMSKVFEQLLGDETCRLKIVSSNTDEMIFEATEADIKQKYACIYRKINELPFQLRVEGFHLQYEKFIAGSESTITVYKKTITCGSNSEKINLMCCPSTYFPQVYKLISGKELNNSDLVFYYEQQLCRFLESLRKIQHHDF